ncbi:MAG: cytochrome b5-like heme/steroid binding domain-containing protein [Patescibacteria group bacterium]
MKKLVTISLFIFWAAVTAILTAGLIQYQNTKTRAPQALSNQTVDPLISALDQTLVLDAMEISRHNSAKDCWLLIDNKVYDVTASIASHPGGAQMIISFCGREASEAFNTKGGGGESHSQKARTMLADYYLGDLGGKIER